MDSIHIHGGVSLQGKVRIQGSKNAALPILAATVLTKEPNVIHNCPRITDVYQMLSLLESIGCQVSWEGDGVRVDAGNMCMGRMPAEAITGMRSSLCLMGALLGRCGEIMMEYPGGCVIGDRPIDLHMQALSCMGVEFCEEEGIICANALDGLYGASIHLPFPSVGATENIILAAVAAEGVTKVTGAAIEPEVDALCCYLQQCGAYIEGIGTGSLHIIGGRKLYGTDYWIPADRIVAGTYLFGCLATGGSVLLEEAPCGHMKETIDLAVRMGADCQITRQGLYVQTSERLNPISCIQTVPYPGFPTDLQSVALTLMTRVEGECCIIENIFENRFRVVEFLNEMGAFVEIIDRKRAVVRGVASLHGRCVEAKELRGGAALVIAGMMADGETIIQGCRYIYRGYENIVKDLRELGARIYSV